MNKLLQDFIVSEKMPQKMQVKMKKHVNNTSVISYN